MAASAVFIVGAGLGYWMSVYGQQLQWNRETRERGADMAYNAGSNAYSGMAGLMMPNADSFRARFTDPSLSENPYLRQAQAQRIYASKMMPDDRMDPLQRKQQYGAPAVTSQINMTQ